MKQTAKPWITPAIQTSINIKNKYYKKFISTKHDFYFAKFKLYRNCLQFLIELSKKSYCDDYFNKYSSDTKKMWSGIKQIITTKSKSLNHPLKISAQNKHEVTDPQQIANSFNEYFANIEQNLVTVILPTNNSPTDYLKNSPAHSFFLFPCTHNEIQLEIDKLTTGKTTGPYSFPAAIIKILKLVIAKPLETIFNFSFQSGVVPSKFKVARVIPVFKSGSKLLRSYYRPISLLPIFNILLEKLVYRRLTSFLEHTKVLSDCQFGFRPKHSTIYTILLIIDKIQKAIESRSYSLGIFLNLKKAFDTVDHKILLKKTGIRGVPNAWFASYLSNRKQFVSIGDTNSDF